MQKNELSESNTAGTLSPRAVRQVPAVTDAGSTNYKSLSLSLSVHNIPSVVIFMCHKLHAKDQFWKLVTAVIVYHYVLNKERRIFFTFGNIIKKS